MRVREWKHMTGADFEALDRRRTVVMVACSPLEVHGPHLPTITDIQESEGLGAAVMERLSARFPELEFVVLPALWVACDVVPQRGSVSFRPGTLVRVLEDLGGSLRRQGFEQIWVSSFHGGPRHFVAIEEACHRVNRRYGGAMISVFSVMLQQLTGGSLDMARVFSGLRGVAAESLEGDLHGGVVETSLMLHLLGEQVRGVYRELPRQTINSWLAERGEGPDRSEEGEVTLAKLVAGFRSKLRFFKAVSYAGDPAAASAEAGAEILEQLSTQAAETLAEVWTGVRSPADCHSPLWPARRLLLSDGLGWAFERAVGWQAGV